jgi:hypothetical protein
MTRLLTDHIVNPTNDRIAIEVMDEPSTGGASHIYDVRLEGWTRDPSTPSMGKHMSSAKQDRCCVIHFQNGPIKNPATDVNGLTQEVLLAIVADRLRSFQAGPYACRENALALTKIEEAMHWLHSRTLARMRRGVEGTHTV